MLEGKALRTALGTVLSAKSHVDNSLLLVDDPRTFARYASTLGSVGVVLVLDKDLEEPSGTYYRFPTGIHSIEVCAARESDPWLMYALVHELGHHILGHGVVTSIPSIYYEFSTEKWTFEFFDEFVPGWLTPEMKAQRVKIMREAVQEWDEYDFLVHPITKEMARWSGYTAPNGIQCRMCRQRFHIDDIGPDGRGKCGPECGRNVEGVEI